MSTKNARTLGLRLDAVDDARLTRFEEATAIEGVSLARAALKAALTQFERKGSLTLPLQIVEAAEPHFAIKEIISPENIDAKTNASLIEKPTGDLQKSPACATPANSSVDSPSSSQPFSSDKKTAGIVRLSPPQFVELGKKLPSLVAEEPPAAVTKKKRKQGGND